MAKKRKLTGGGAMTAPQHPECKTGSLEEGKPRPITPERAAELLSPTPGSKLVDRAMVEKMAKDILEGKFKVPGLEITPQTAERILREINERPKIVVDYHVDKAPVVAQNLVQWLPRNEYGEEMIRIAVAGGTDREYLFMERTGLFILEYLDKMIPVRYVLVEKNDTPVNCTCKDFLNRGKACKHIRALSAALKQRRAPIEFGGED